MLFLADESFDFDGVRALRTTVYDVLAVAEVARGASDEAVLDLATRNARILLTDKDFGELYAAKAGWSAGMLLARFPASARDSQASSVVEAANRGSQLDGSSVVVQPGRIRRLVSSAEVVHARRRSMYAHTHHDYTTPLAPKLRARPGPSRP